MEAIILEPTSPAKKHAPRTEMDDEGELQRLYAWVDEIPLSRPKRNFTRDFSDGVLVAEIVNHFAPKIIDLHNYSAANATQQKMYNWNTLNQRPFKRLQMQISKADITDVCNCVPNAVEKVLRVLNAKVSKFLSRQQALKGQEPLSAQEPVANPTRAATASSEPRFAGAGGSAPPSRGGAGPSAGGRWQPEEAQHQQDPPQSAPQHQPDPYYQPPQPQPAHQQQQPQQQPAYPATAPGGGGADRAAIDALELQRQVDTEILIEKEQTIQELRETVEILELKVKKLEQLVRIKDSKIHTMANKMAENGLV